MAVSLYHFESVNEQLFEVVFDLERFSSGRTRKSWGIENDHMKFLALAGEARQHRPHIIRNEAMVQRRQAVQHKILASALQRFFGKIDVEGARSAGRRAYGKRARIGETVQQSSRRDVAHVAAIFPLVQEEARRIARPEIESELQMSLGGDCL